MSSIRAENVDAMENASGKLGSYLPSSMEMTVWRDTPSFSARACCDQPLASRSSLTLFFIDRVAETALPDFTNVRRALLSIAGLKGSSLLYMSATIVRRARRQMSEARNRDGLTDMEGI